MRNSTLIFFLLFSLLAAAQQLPDPNVRTKRLVVTDSVQLDSVSLNPSFFEVRLKNGAVIDSSQYTVNFGRSIFSFRESAEVPMDTLIFTYKTYPDYLTRNYYLYDRKRIVKSTGALSTVQQLNQERELHDFTPFEGLNVSGSIVRGVTVGNNQNSTVNSELDLQISGKLSDKVGLRASIQDANIPQQDGGYSQRLDEFDQIFIELYSDRWNIRAGDIDLENTTSYFGRFHKKIRGLSLHAQLGSEETETNLFATGALVRGVFAQSRFNGQEGNQGPYKLTGPNGELYVLIISGSERVYVNGLLLKRGESEDYVIDYNAGEIRFNPTFPITSEMRIAVEYQYSEQNYTRVIAYAGGEVKTNTNKLNLRAHVYSESDAKNQPLLQNLNEAQVQVLKNAGDDGTQMTASSVTPDTYSENKILYRKETHNGQEIYIFSTDQNEALFNVRFSQVGANQGDYILSSNDAISNIYEYVAPVNGVPQGNFAPVIRLFAPTKLQMAVVQGSYNPSEKTSISFEGAGSKNDLNLFSSIDDANDNGFAGRLNVSQQIFGGSQAKSLTAYADLNYIQNDFRNIERIYNIEFGRDWNLPLYPIGDQTYASGALKYIDTTFGTVDYRFEKLTYSGNYSGGRHTFSGVLERKNTSASINASYLQTEADTAQTDFLRLYARGVQRLGKAWAGAVVSAENNVLKNNGNLDLLSQRFQAYQGFVGVGDSTQVFAEVGYRRRLNDSIRDQQMTRVNTSNTYYLKAQLIKNESTSLGLFVNYRKLKYTYGGEKSEQSLNSRLLFDQNFFNRLIRWNTVFETSSGTQPRQEFTYVKVDEGQGVYTWKDYNNDGIQQLQEFEIAQFKDEARFVRVLLPNRIFVKTHNNKLSQLLTLDPQQWSGQAGLRKLFSHFYNQTSYLIDRKILRRGDAFDINPFNDSADQLGLNLNLRNTLYFNRGRQEYSTSYTYLATTTTNLLSIGLQENRLRSHQLNFLHKVKDSYLLNFKGELSRSTSLSENFEQRNYKLKTFDLSPKLSYLINDRSRVEFFYTLSRKRNQIGELEQLVQQDLGLAFSYAESGKLSLNGELKYINNSFDGSAFSPVAYQMLEGLQPGTNFTWNLTAQRRLTKFLDLNLSYFGRSSENSRTVHTGSVQLRAFF